jgi:hypothetical protein
MLSVKIVQAAKALLKRTVQLLSGTPFGIRKTPHFLVPV